MTIASEIKKGKIGRPIFIKEYSNISTQLAELPELLNKLRQGEKKIQVYKRDRIKIFEIFSNLAIKGLVVNKPKNRQELLKIDGFDENKVEKYGNKILRVTDN